MKRSLPVLLIALALAVWVCPLDLFAQDAPTAPGDPDPPAPEKPAEGDKGAPEAGGEEKPAGEGEGEPDKKPEPPKISIEQQIKEALEYKKHPDKRVEVVLKRGTIFEGIARKGVLAETIKTIDVPETGRKEQVYVEVKEKALIPKRGARNVFLPISKKSGIGIRIWYYRQTRGFVYIDFSDVTELRIVRELSYKDSKRLFQAIEDKEKRLLAAEQQAREEEKRRDEMRTQMEREKREKELAERKGLTAEEAAKRKEWRDELLKKFPPGAEWNKDRKTRIMVKMVNGINPTDDEKDFYKRFEEWEEAVKEDEFLKSGK